MIHRLPHLALLLTTVVAGGTFASSVAAADRIDLAGAWSLRLDPDDQGITQQWFTAAFPETVQLPGSLQAQGFGDVPTLETHWTGSIRPEVIYMPRYTPYRDPANFKMPFWLQPKRYYIGPAWYQRHVTISSPWEGQRITLHLERCHWFTQVWVDGQQAGTGESLSAAHEFDLTKLLTPGKHTLTIRVDNRLIVDVGDNSHSVTDHTQTNWNGIIGDIELRAGSPVWISDVQVYPDTIQRIVQVAVRVDNHTLKPANVQLDLSAFQGQTPLAAASTPMLVEGESAVQVITLPMGEEVKLWSEHEPNLCLLKASVTGVEASSGVTDQRSVHFGMRDITVRGTEFLLNGQPIIFRGTLECCIFPLTGFPPTDVDSWKHVIRQCKAFGLNHIRFHSWCPPEAAFQAADELGFYYQVECASWANGGASVGDGKPLDEWLNRETDRILQAYGNHPSFILLAYGNEPAGPGPQHQGEDYLSQWVNRYKQKAVRQLVTCASGWPYLAESQFHVMHHPLRQQGVFNSQPPETTKDYRAQVAKFNVPLISHETGQWCVFPNLEEMKQYTGVLEAKNFEIVRDFLEQHKLLGQAQDFLMASGALQTLLYKEEIEVLLRTPGLGGFQLLDLHDFPGQGTALIGVLDPFWNPKPFITAEAFRRFCGPVVPLARLTSRTWTNDQTLTADVEVSQYDNTDLLDRTVVWALRTDRGQSLCEGRWTQVDLPRNGLRRVGSLECALAGVTQASRLRLSVSIEGTPYGNDWDIWVYPKEVETAPADDVLVAQQLDDGVRERLQAGGKVLLLLPRYAIAGDTSGSFEAVFWNRLWFPTQQVHTLGILCDPGHPALEGFPTDSHSNWQWWDLCKQSKPVIMDDLPEGLSPIVQVIDDWNTCRKLGLVFEAKVGSGKLLLCGIDLEKDLAARPVARQLRYSLLRHMASDRFAPDTVVPLEALEALLRQPSRLQELGAEVTADSQQAGYEAALALDGNPDTIWHTSWGEQAAAYPHELVLDLQSPQSITGLTYLPRQDMSNGRIAQYAIHTSSDARQWGEPVATGQWPDDGQLKTVRFPAAVTARYVKLVGLSEVRGQTFASAAELDVIQQ